MPFAPLTTAQIKDVEIRKKWDDNLLSATVLERSRSHRFEVVHTRQRHFGLIERESVEKRLHFSVVEDAETRSRLQLASHRSRRGQYGQASGGALQAPNRMNKIDSETLDGFSQKVYYSYFSSCSQHVLHNRKLPLRNRLKDVMGENARQADTIFGMHRFEYVPATEGVKTGMDHLDANSFSSGFDSSVYNGSDEDSERDSRLIKVPKSKTPKRAKGTLRPKYRVKATLITQVNPYTANETAFQVSLDRGVIEASLRNHALSFHNSWQACLQKTVNFKNSAHVSEVGFATSGKSYN